MPTPSVLPSCLIKTDHKFMGKGPESVIVDFIWQLGWVTVPGYLVKHYSGCFYKCIFWMRLAFKSVDFE